MDNLSLSPFDVPVRVQTGVQTVFFFPAGWYDMCGSAADIDVYRCIPNIAVPFSLPRCWLRDGKPL